MPNADRDHHDGFSGEGLTRREALRRLGLLGAAAAAGPAFLAACSSSKKSTSSTSSGGGTTGSGDAGSQLASILKIDPSANNGKGTAWQMGAVLALTGNGSFYGKTMSRGIDLAVKHITAAGGPDIKVVYKDHKSGDPQAGIQAVTELGTAGVPAKLASYGDDILAMLPGTKQYKIFTLDGGGGAEGNGQGQPYFWGTRAQTPVDPEPGLYQYIKQTLPKAKSIGLTGWDLGAQNNEIGKQLLLQSLQGTGLTFNNLYELFPPNSTDYSGVVAKIKANEPDILLVFAYGQDPGFFLDQAQTANLKAKIFGFEFTPDGVNASKGAYDSVGWTFAYDYFDAASAPNPLAKLFVKEFKAAYGLDPDFYAANYYEDTIGMWDIIRRVLAKGGDINKGEQLDAAFQDKLVLNSVYGGDSSTLGTLELDPKTHSVKRRQMGVFEYKDKKVTPKCFFNIGGADFKMA